MKISDINIRDPFILVHDNKYYLYGTRVMDEPRITTGFDVYVSCDLENWSEPVSVFEYYDGFWADENFWAPEVYEYNGKFYMFASFKGMGHRRCTGILAASAPDAKFSPISDGPVTPEEWECLDGTFYVEDGKPYMVFCHEWKQCMDGEICAIELSSDLTHAVSGPKLLWKATDAKWVVECCTKDCYVTDGPFLRKLDDLLICIWSSFGEHGYCEAVAYSDNGRIDGVWHHNEQPLFDRDQGHGMLFDTTDGQLMLMFHSPNTHQNERPQLVRLTQNDITRIKKEAQLHFASNK